jgi:hypothetical protein
MMSTTGKPPRGERQLSGLEPAALAAGLNAVVDRLEADWRSRRLIAQETVEQLRDLRIRAERLFRDAT